MLTSCFEGLGGLNIFTRTWLPAGLPRAAVVIVHGFNSHSGYYQWTAEKLVARGFSVHALDLPGRGQSDGERFFVKSFNDYVADIATFFAQVRAGAPGIPLFLLGHSAGGVAACLYAVTHQADLAGLICESFAYELPAPGFALAVLKGLGHVAPHAHVLKLKNEDFSRDPAVVTAMNNDPLIAHEVQPTSTIAAMVRADERLKKAFPQIKIPLLILHGTADRAAKPSGSQHFFEQAGAPDKTLKLYEGYFHDPLNDLGKEAVIADIETWILKHIPA
jgi:acylglycerol lipase